MNYIGGCVDEYDFDYPVKMMKMMSNHPLLTSKQKEKQMSNIDKAKQAVESAQKQLEEAVKALEQAEKKASKIGLKIPKIDEHYYAGFYGSSSIRSNLNAKPYLASFDSTNKAQQSAFQEALVVMAEMRMQDGIVVPFEQPAPSYTISLEINDYLAIDGWYNSVGISLFPAFESRDAAQTAINAVGEHRIINCIKTMMFMTPESRGEIE